MDNRLMTVKELAAYVQLSISKIYHDAGAGMIPCLRWGRQEVGRKPVLRFRKEEIDLWLTQGCPGAREFVKNAR